MKTAALAATLSVCAGALADPPAAEYSRELNHYFQGQGLVDWEIPAGWPILGEVNEYYDSMADTVQWDGDRLGYAANGAGDVDGDGFDDQIINYYFRGKDLDSDGVLDPDTESRFGLVEVISGADGTRIGEAIDGELEDDWLAHAVTHIDLPMPWEFDSNGDRVSHRKEIVLCANRAGRGKVWVYTYADPDWFQGDSSGIEPMDSPEWIEVIEIEGEDRGQSVDWKEQRFFGFSASHSHLSLNEDDPNDVDDTPDLLVRSRRYFDEDGAFWAFCMPRKAFWAGLAESNLPIELESDDASLFIHADGVSPADGEFANGGGGVGDLDGDGELDIALSSGKHNGGDGAMYLYFSSVDRGSGTTFSDLSPVVELDGTDDWARTASPTTIELELKNNEYDFAIFGSSSDPLAGGGWGKFTGDDLVDLIVTDGDEIHVYDFEAVVSAAVSNMTFPTSRPTPMTTPPSITVGVDPCDSNEMNCTNWYAANAYATITMPVRNDSMPLGWAASGSVGDVNADGYEDLSVRGYTVTNQYWEGVLVLGFSDLTEGGAEYDVLLEYIHEKPWKPDDSMTTMVDERVGDDGNWKPVQNLDAEVLDGAPSQRTGVQARVWPGWDANADGLDDLLLGAYRYPWPIPAIEETLPSGGMSWIQAEDGIDASGNQNSEHDDVTPLDNMDLFDRWSFYIDGCSSSCMPPVRHAHSDPMKALPAHTPFATVGKMYLLHTPAFLDIVEENDVTPDSIPCKFIPGYAHNVNKVLLTGGGLKPDGTDFVGSDVTIADDATGSDPVVCTVSSGGDSYDEIELYVIVPDDISVDTRTVSIELESGQVVSQSVTFDTGSGLLRSDLDLDGVVSSDDVAMLISMLGGADADPKADLDGDQDIDADDLMILLQSF